MQAIPLGVTPMPVPADAPARRVGLGIGRAPYVLFVGTREPRKGLDVLVTAMGHAELSHPDLVVVGPIGWGDVDVLTASNHAGIGSRVHLLGAVSDETSPLSTRAQQPPRCPAAPKVSEFPSSKRWPMAFRSSSATIRPCSRPLAGGQPSPPSVTRIRWRRLW